MSNASYPLRRFASTALLVEGLLAVLALAIDFLINLAANDVGTSIKLRVVMLVLVPLVLLAGGLALILRLSSDMSEFLATARVRNLDLSDIRFNLGPNPGAVYFERDAFRQSCELIRKVVAGTPSGYLGLLVVGVSLVGKTRLALESLRCAAPDVELLVWPHLSPGVNARDLLDALDRFRGKPLAVLLDDLAEYAPERESAFVLTAMDKLRKIARPLVILATTRPRDDLATVEDQFDSLVERLFRVTLTPMEPGAEATAFLREMESAGIELHRRSFDGTPGAALLDIDRRCATLSGTGDKRFPTGALAVLESLALLRQAQIYTYPETRVRRVAQGVFELPSNHTSWAQAMATLLSDGWLRLATTGTPGEHALRLPTAAYLDKCLVDTKIYPWSDRRIQDDFPRLLEALSGTPSDADGLFRLASALRQDPIGNIPQQRELALKAVMNGLAGVNQQDDAELWATGQGTLGLTYAVRIRSSRADNLQTAIACFEKALSIFSRETYPVQWAVSQNNLGTAYVNRIRGDRADNVEKAIAYHISALTFFSPEAYRVRWAQTQRHLGIAYVNRVRGDRADNIERAITFFGQTVSVFTPKEYPIEWARTQNSLGNAYVNRIEGEEATNLEQAITCYQQALDILTRETYPVQWAETQNNLGAAYVYRIEGDRADNLKQASNCLTAVLTIFTREDFPADWARTISNLALVHAYSGEEAKRRGDYTECCAQQTAALEGMRSALSVYTAEEFPGDYTNILEQIAWIEELCGDDFEGGTPDTGKA